MPRSSRSDRVGNQAFWKSLVEQWRASGQQVRGFCRKHRVAETAFYYWRKRLADEAGKASPGRRPGRAKGALAAKAAEAQEAAPAFVPVRVTSGGAGRVTPGRNDSATPAPTDAIEIVLTDGTLVRLPATMDDERLGGILAAVRAAPC